MTEEGIRSVILHLMTYFPKYYSPDMEQSKVDLMKKDLFNAYEQFSDDEILQAYKEMLLLKATAPAISEILEKARAWRKSNEREETPEEEFRGVPNPHSRAVKEMLKARIKMGINAKNDPHDLAWYIEQYPQRPEDNNVYSMHDLLKDL